MYMHLSCQPGNNGQLIIDPENGEILQLILIDPFEMESLKKISTSKVHEAQLLNFMTICMRLVLALMLPWHTF